MKKFFFLLAFLPTVLFAQNPAAKFVINGNISGLANGEVKITTTQDDHRVIASGTSTNGVFNVEGSIPEPGLYFIVLSNEQPQYIVLALQIEAEQTRRATRLPNGNIQQRTEDYWGYSLK